MTNINDKTLSVVKKILLATVDVSATIYDIFQYPSMKYARDSKMDRSVIYNTVSRLKNEGYLKVVETRGHKRYLTTLKGKAKILAYLKKDTKWDGKWRIVVFDIPEKKRKMRDYFRSKLIDLGYRKLQDSVWISPHNTADVIEELIEYCRADNYVHYLLVEELDDKEKLMKLFSLKYN